MQLKRLAPTLLLIPFVTLVGCSGGGGGIGDTLQAQSASDGAAVDPATGAEAVPTLPSDSADPDGQPDAVTVTTLNDPETGAAGAVTAGKSVDCGGELPCQWQNDSGSFSISATRADNTSSDGKLEVLFRIGVLHDTSVLLGNSQAAVGASTSRYKPARQRLGDGNGLAPIELLAGDTVEGALTYAEKVSDSSLQSFHLATIDNGTPYSAIFNNLPVGSAVSDTADCALKLPCTWASADGVTRVTVVSAGGYNVNGRLGVNFLVETGNETDIVLDAGSLAVGSDGLPIKALNHRLGSLSDFKAVTHHLFADIALGGAVAFVKSASEPGSLARLDLALYADTPQPRWNPRFSAVPVQ